LLGSLKPGDRVTLEFPMVTAREQLTYYVQHNPRKPLELTFEFKGNTAVGFTPRPPLAAGHVPIYQRAHYRQDKAPMVKKERFVPAKLIRW
jgi:hypothetical protein